MDSKKYINRVVVLGIIVLALYGAISAVNWVILPPSTFPTPYRVTINSGQSLFSISEELSKDGAIRSKRVFEMLMMTFGSDKTINKGEN